MCAALAHDVATSSEAASGPFIRIEFMYTVRGKSVEGIASDSMYSECMEASTLLSSQGQQHGDTATCSHEMCESTGCP